MAMHGVRADHEALGNLRVAQGPCATSPSTSRSRSLSSSSPVGVGLARRSGRASMAQERGDRAQDSITVPVATAGGRPPGSVTSLRMRQQRGDLACASQPHRAIVLTMHGPAPAACTPRQVLAHVCLVG